MSLTSSGFSRTEVLVFLALLVILACALAGPISSHLEQSRMKAAVEKARTINTLLSQYATDNNDVYPVGQGTSVAGKSEGIAQNLLDGKYAQEPEIFALGSTAAYAGTATDFSDFTAANIGWDFTAGATSTTGLTAQAPALLPMLYCAGESVTYPSAPGTGLDLPLSGHGPFAKKGIVVAYKDGSVSFIKGAANGDATQAMDFISRDYTDTTAYTQIKP